MVQVSRLTQSRTVQIDGDLLECQWQAPGGSAPTLVFLHEGLGCVQMWRDFPYQLAAQTGLGMLNYSRSGYGGSSPAVLPRQADYMHHEAIVVLPQVLEAFDIQSAVVVGHSDGGSIAIIHAGSETASQIKGLILLAPHVFVEPLSIESIAQAAKLYRTTDLPDKLSRYHGPSVDNTFWGWNDIWLHEDFRNWNIESYLPDINVPVLLLQGAQDQYGTLAQLKAIESQVSGLSESHLIQDCGHAPHRDQSKAVLKLCGRFIDMLISVD